MGTTKKILITALMTFVIAGSCGYYLYKQYTASPKVYGSEYIVVFGRQQVTPSVSLQHVGPVRYRSVFLMDNAGGYAPDLVEIPLSSPGSVSSPKTALPLKASDYSGRALKLSDSFYASGGSTSGLLAAGVGSGRKSSSAFSGGGGTGVSIAGSTTALSRPEVPFAAPPTRGGGIGGGDPGGDPGSFIPVGDGWWMLLLSAAGYGFMRKKIFKG